MNPETLIDGYKVDHKRQYPNGTEVIFSNLTARKTRRPNTDSVVFFGLQYFIKRYLIKEWNEEFFKKPKAEVLARFKRRIDNYLGPNNVGIDHISALHDLQYLPIAIYALPEGTVYPLRVPSLVIYNTKEEFFWLTNYLETILSTSIWGMCTSATTSYQYKKLLKKAALDTVGEDSFVQWQGHDFSFRGMFGLEAAQMSGAAHLLSFAGTDTLPAIDFLEEYYNANCEKELVGGSVAATEHSVMCAGGDKNEFGTITRLITEVYPSGIVSIVFDTWDFWRGVSEYLPALKQTILNRDGKVVIRPDTGDPVDIVCGDPEAPIGSPAYKGAIECLWDTFGGTVSPKGYKVLNPKIGLIYGDSITLDRAEKIIRFLEQKGFASTNIVFGIGSYTFQYCTRDTDGYAVKATMARINGEDIEIFKNPKTDNGTKKSAKGLTSVFKNDKGDFYLKDQSTWAEVQNCEFKLVFLNSELVKDYSLSEIRNKLNAH